MPCSAARRPEILSRLQVANLTLQALLAGGAAVTGEQVQALVDICGAAAPALANMSGLVSGPGLPTVEEASAAEQALARVFEIVSGVQTALLASLVSSGRVLPGVWAGSFPAPAAPL